MNTTSDLHEYVGALGFVLLGAPTAVANTLVAAAIAKYSALRNRKEMVILMALAVADALDTASHAAAGVYRLTVLRSDGPNSRISTVIGCLRLPHMWTWPFASSLARCMLVIISADRFLLVALREKYVFDFGIKYAWGTVSVTYLSNLIFCWVALITAAVLGDPQGTVSAMCYSQGTFVKTTDNVVNRTYFDYHSYGLPFLTLLSVIIFALIPPVYKYRKGKVGPQDNGLNASVQFKRQQKLTKTMGISALCTLLLICIPQRLGFYLWYETDMKVLSRIVFIVQLGNPLANCIIYQFSQPDLRKAVDGLLHRKQLPTNIDLWHPKTRKTKTATGTDHK